MQSAPWTDAAMALCLSLIATVPPVAGPWWAAFLARDNSCLSLVSPFRICRSIGEAQPCAPTLQTMKLRLSELDCAVRDAFQALTPTTFADLARRASECGEEDPELTFEQAAVAVTGALVMGALVNAVDTEQSLMLAVGLPLSNIRIDGAQSGEPVYLPAAAVAIHPLFAPWIGSRLDEAVGHMLKAGAIWTQLAIGSPVFEELQITDYGATILGAHVRTSWPRGNGEALTVTASYGAAGAEVPLRRVLAVNGNSIVTIGCGTPLVDQASRADEAATATAIKTAAAAAGAQVH